MNIQEKQIKQIQKTYNYTLKYLQKNFFEDTRTGLTIFIEYLRYLRDTLIINSNDLSQEGSENFTVASITTAIAEFESYENCCLVDAGEQLVSFHWNNFWELVKQNMGEWLKFNDSI